MPVRKAKAITKTITMASKVRKTITKASKRLKKVQKSSRALGRVGGVPVEPDTSFQMKASAILGEKIKDGKWPGVAAAVFVDGKCVLLEEAGYASIENKTPMTASSVSRIYSMTKCVISAGVLMLVEEGKLRINDRLDKHIPAFKHEGMKVPTVNQDGSPGRLRPASRPIRILHLLTHTSGISGGDAKGIDRLGIHRRPEDQAWCDIYKPLVDQVNNGEIKNLASWVEELAKLPLWEDPGTKYSYGYSYDILGRIIELKSGMRLEAFIKKRIFDPLGMKSTRFSLQPKNLATLYRRTKSSDFGGNGKKYRLAPIDPANKKTPSLWSKCAIPSGGGCISSFEGGLLSNLDDYSTFLLTVTNGGTHPRSGVRILSKKSASQMLQDHTALLRSAGKEIAKVSPALHPYDSRGLGLCLIGEYQRAGAPNWNGGWFDGVEDVRLWGGAASTFFKYDENGGNPILVMTFTQVVPQDDGRAITALLAAARDCDAAKGYQQ